MLRIPALALSAQLALAGAATAASLVPTEPPAELPDLALETADGQTIGLDAFRGKTAVVNLWATWCAPCLAEMPSLDAMQAALADENVAVVAISVDRGSVETARLQDFYDELGLEHLEIFRDRKFAASRALHAQGLPTTLVLDAEGREVARVIGEIDWMRPDVLETIRAVTPR
jgi:thiol-disulfide isomerase/thioredoxin